MKICFLAATLNPRTGAGEASSRIIDGVRAIQPLIQVKILTAEDELASSGMHLMRRLPRVLWAIGTSDIVHALDAYPYGVIAILAARLTRTKVVVTAIGTGSIQRLKGNGLKSLLLRFAYRRAEKVTAISTYVAQEINKILPKVQIQVVNHGVDYNFYSAHSSEELSSSGLYIITQGEFKRRKGYSEIFPVFKRLTEKFSNLEYVIVANPKRNLPYQEELNLLMVELKIKDRVKVRSDLTREELRSLYQQAALYVSLPKDDRGDVEGFGLSILEAAASGTPAVVGWGSGADDAVKDGKSGYLVQDTREAFNKSSEILSDGALRKRLSDGAQAWAREMSWENQIKKYVKIYEAI